MRQPIRIVGFVGTGVAGDYAKAKYSLEGFESDRVRLMSAALCSIAKKRGVRVQGVELLGTPEALAYYNTSLVDATETIRGIVGRAPCTTTIDAGGSDEGLRRLFMAVHAALGPEARPELGESERPGEIWLDTTHGYRAQSFLGAAALAYTLSDWSRRRLDVSPEIRVFYAFFDDASPNVAQPIWDLTEFVAATRWNAALDGLVRFGRADDVLALAKADDHAGSSFPSRLGKAAHAFAEDLTLIRLRDLFVKSSMALANVLDDTKEPGYRSFIERRPYLAAPFAALRDLAKKLAAPNVLGKEGLRATAHLARTYGELQQFAGQMVAVREAVITAYAIADGLAQVEPGSGCKGPRGKAEKAWQAAVKSVSDGGAPAPSPAGQVAAFSAAVQGPRNDVEHAGIRDDPEDARSLRAKAEQLAKDLVALVGTIAP